MRKIARFHGTAFLITALAAAFFTTGAFAQVLRLEKPGTDALPFAAKQAGGPAFPEEKAGLAAYVKLDAISDLVKFADAFPDKTIEEIGREHILGTVRVQHSPKNIDIDAGFYADIDGWIVTYLAPDETAKALQWGPKSDNPDLLEMKTTPLADALVRAGNAAGLATDSWDIKHHHFGYPDADHITFVLKAWKDGDMRMQFQLPSDYVLYELALVLFGRYGDIYIDGEEVLAFSKSRLSRFGSHRTALARGTLHSVLITRSSSSSSTDQDAVLAFVSKKQ